VLVVTSTCPGAGKTLRAINLAVAPGASGKRVLLVDADMRKPQTHAVIRTRRTPGLSDVLVGNAKPSEVIQQRLEQVPFSYMPSGTTVPSPADLLTTRTMAGLVDGLRKFYDWIILDTPPVGAVVEPLILAPLADGVVVVTGAEMVPRKAVGHTLERISETGARILGIILNRANLEKHSYYYNHYYGHYYGNYGRSQPTAANAPRDAARKLPGGAKVARINDKRSAER
jgi:capsular exopolysaccharide synthesis family protein